MKNKLLTALLSAGIAVLLWLYVVTVVSPNSDNRYYNIPINLQGEAVLQDRSLMIVSGELPTASLHLEGNRTDLNKINSSNISIGVDVSGIGEPGEYTLNLTQPSFLSGVTNNAITVLSKDPGTVTVEVDRRISKPVPVDIQYEGTLPENYMVDKENAALDFETVNIAGPQAVVNQIAMARIDVNLDNQVESLSQQYRYTLCNEKGEPVDAQLIVTDVEAINLTLKIARVKEVMLTLAVVEGGGATEETSTITIDPQVILVSGSDTLLEDMDTLEIGSVNLGTIASDEELTFPIKLPDGVTNETGVTEATVKVQFPQLATKKLTVTAIEAVNVPSGLQVQLATKRLEILLRGPKGSVEKLKPEDIKVKVNFSGVTAGAASVKAEISTNVTGVGAVGTYNVTATLKAK